MQVLDDEHDRRRLAEPAEQPQHALEDADLEPLGLARRGRVLAVAPRELGHEPCQFGQAGSRRSGDAVCIDLATQDAERLDDGTERQAVVTEGDRAAFEHEPVVSAKLARHLCHEATLADPGLTGDEGEPGLAGHGSVGRREERLLLPRSTDEDRAGEAPSHGADDMPWLAPHFTPTPRRGAPTRW